MRARLFIQDVQVSMFLMGRCKRMGVVQAVMARILGEGDSGKGQLVPRGRMPSGGLSLMSGDPEVGWGWNR